MSSLEHKELPPEILLQQGIAALRRRDREHAAVLFKQVLQQNPHDAHAWVWLSETVTSDSERRYCLEKALTHQPNYPQATKGLTLLPAGPAVPPAWVATLAMPAATDPALPDISLSTSVLDTSPDVVQPVGAAPTTLTPAAVGTPDLPVAPNQPAEHAARPTWWLTRTEALAVSIVVVLALLVSLGVGWTLFGYLTRSQPRSEPAAVVAPIAASTSPAATAVSPQVGVDESLVLPQPGVMEPELLAYGDDHAAAIADYTDQLTANPHDARLYFLRGRAYFEQKEYLKSRADMQQALALAPDNPVYYLHLGRTYTFMDDYEQGIRHFTKALQLAPDYADAYLKRGVALKALGNTAAAVVDYERVIQLAPEYPISYNNLGNILRDTGRYSDAITTYNQALQRDPTEGLFYYNRAAAYQMAHDYQAALDDYNQALTLGLGTNCDCQPNAYTSRGWTRKQFGDFVGAEADYTEALRIDPQFAAALLNRASVRIDLRNYDGALADYNELLRLYPNNLASLVGRGIVYHEMGDIERAIAEYEQVLRLNPMYSDAYLQRGVARSDLGDLPGAYADYSRAIQLNPRDYTAYTNRGSTSYKLGDLDAARADYEQAIASNPRYAYAYFGRGIIRQETGDGAGAQADFDQAAALATEQGNTALVEMVRTHAAEQ